MWWRIDPALLLWRHHPGSERLGRDLTAFKDTIGKPLLSIPISLLAEITSKMSSKQLHAPRDGIYRSKAKSVESFPDHMDLYSFMFEDFRSLRVSKASFVCVSASNAAFEWSAQEVYS